jgi:uncharacterized protein (TIGR02246 family)
MRHRLVVAAVLCGWQFTALAEEADSEKQIRALVAEQVDAWNAGDARRWVRAASPEISFTNIYGAVRFGAADFTRRQEEVLGTFFKGTTKQHTIKRIRFISTDIALVDIDNEVRGVKSMPPGIAVPRDGVLRTQLFQVFARRDGRWWMEAFHNVDLKEQR